MWSLSDSVRVCSIEHFHYRGSCFSNSTYWIPSSTVFTLLSLLFTLCSHLATILCCQCCFSYVNKYYVWKLFWYFRYVGKLFPKYVLCVLFIHNSSCHLCSSFCTCWLNEVFVFNVKEGLYWTIIYQIQFTWRLQFKSTTVRNLTKAIEWYIDETYWFMHKSVYMICALCAYFVNKIN